MSMFTYVTLGVNDFEAALHFYDQLLAALGWSRCDPDAPPGWAGWACTRTTVVARQRCGSATRLTAGGHRRQTERWSHWRPRLASRSRSFIGGALAAGGRSEGAPGLRPALRPDFFAAYVRDPDGNKLAAVCRAPALQAPTGPIKFEEN